MFVWYDKGWRLCRVVLKYCSSDVELVYIALVCILILRTEVESYDVFHIAFNAVTPFV